MIGWLIILGFIIYLVWFFVLSIAAEVHEMRDPSDW